MAARSRWRTVADASSPNLLCTGLPHTPNDSLLTMSGVGDLCASKIRRGRRSCFVYRKATCVM